MSNTAEKTIAETSTSIKRLNRNSKVFKSAINAILDKKGSNIISLDLRKIDEAVADFFIICEAQSNIQINAIANNIERKLREDCKERPYHFEEGDTWTLIDYVNIVIHVFHPEERKFYDLEGLWMDAQAQQH